MCINRILLVCTSPSLSPLFTRSLFSISVNLFLFCISIHLYYILYSTYKWYRTGLSFSVWLTSLSIITSESIHVVANSRISFFFFCGWVVSHSEKAMAPHSSTLALKIPWTEEPGRLRSMVSLRVGHDWATSLSLFTFMHWRRKWQPTPVFLPGESQGREAWWAAVYGVAQSQTWLKRLSSSSSISLYVCMYVNVCVCIYTYTHTTSSLSIHLLMDTLVASIHWQL